MNILLVEDDSLQANQIGEFLTSGFPESQVELIRTEQEFRAQLPAMEERPPDVVVLDVMLRWTDPSPVMEPRPEEVRKGGIFEAGLRCRDLLAARDKTREIPVILYTVLERIDLGSAVAGTMLLSKESDPEALIKAIRAVTQTGS